uniref:Ribosomal protein n=1 Tax=Accipiter nisus TaxID=211598 RepID=A0A8B9NI03_9AVES
LAFFYTKKQVKRIQEALTQGYLLPASSSAVSNPGRAPALWSGAAAPSVSLPALSPPPGLLLPPAVLLAGLKTKTSLKRRCKDCFIVRRRGRLYVLCKTNPRHKQRKL